MAYLKKQLNEPERDSMRVNLSVRTQKLSPEPVCDFCGAPDPVVMYAASRMSTGEALTCWRWTACATCEALVDSNDWEAIEKRLEVRLATLSSVPIPKDLVHFAIQGALNDFHRYAIGV